MPSITDTPTSTAPAQGNDLAPPGIQLAKPLAVLPPVALSVGQERNLAQLRRELGVIADILYEPYVTDVMLNPDGRLWVQKLGVPMHIVGVMDEVQAMKLLRIVSHMVGASLSEKRPTLACSLPLDGCRVQGWVPPVVASPTFCLRKPASMVFTFEDYVAQNVMSQAQADYLRNAIKTRKNILVAGGMGSGKTTFCNAMLDAMAKVDPDTRAFIIEDVAELQCKLDNAVGTLAVEGVVTAEELLKTGLRSNAARFLVGEVRDGMAATLLNAWGTGQPGGMATIHANSSLHALTRMERLVRMAGVPADPAAIAEAVNLVAYMQMTPEGRKLTSLLEVTDYNERTKKYIAREVAQELEQKPAD